MTYLDEFTFCGQLATSGAFDHTWYLRTYPDVAASGMDPVLHYVRHGKKEGRFRNEAERQASLTSPGSSGNHLACDSGTNPEVLPEIPVVFAANREFIKYAGVAISSLIEHVSPIYYYKIYILHTGIEPWHFEPLRKLEKANVAISQIDVEPRFGDLFADSFVSHSISKDTYLRLLIPSLFEQYQKILYLDSDLIVCTDISQFYHSDLDGYALGGVAEPVVETPFFKEMAGRLPFDLEKNYFNAGVLLMNIEALNSSGKAKKALDMALSGQKFIGWDQEILNIVCHGSIKPFPMRWNLLWMHIIGEYYRHMMRHDFLAYAEAIRNPAIIHFASQRKPWKIDDGYFSNIFWKYAQKSPFYNQLLTECPYKVKVAGAPPSNVDALRQTKKAPDIKTVSRRRKFDIF